MNTSMDTHKNVIENEPIFRAILAELRLNEFYIPGFVDPNGPIENILKYVARQPSTNVGEFRIPVFSRGPVEPWAPDISESQAVIAYENMSHFNNGNAMLLYDILPDGKVKLNSTIFRSPKV